MSGPAPARNAGARPDLPTKPASRPPTPPRREPPVRPPRVRVAIGWSYLLTAGRVGSSIVVTFLLAKLLGPAEFGLVAMATVFVIITQTVVQQGLFTALVQRDRLDEAHLQAAFGVLLLVGAAASLLAAAFSPLWALVNRAPELTAVCVALSPLVLIQALAVVPEALLRRDLRFRVLAGRTVLAAVLSGVTGVALALAGAGVWALVGQQVSNALISLAVLWSRSPWRPGRRLRLTGIGELWRFSAHSASAGIAWLVGSRADVICAGIFFGPVATGIYRLASRLPDMLVDVTARSIQQVALPSLSRLQRDHAEFATHLTRLQHLGAVAGLPALGILAALADPLVALLGPQWAGTATPLRLLCLYGAVNVYTVLLGPALQAIGQPGRLAVVSWARTVLAVSTLATVGMLMSGGDDVSQAVAVALTGVATQAAIGAVLLWLTVRRAVSGSLRRFFAPTLPAVAATVAAAAVPLGTARLGVAVLAPLAALAVTAGASAAVAATVLWLTDRPLRRLVLDRARPSRSGG